MTESLKFRAFSPPQVWIVAPSPPPYGGMSVQAEKLSARLRSEGVHAELIPTNPSFPWPLRWVERLPGLRTIVREVLYLLSLVRIIRNPGVVHHFSASYLYFFLHSAPLLFLGKFSTVRVALNYRGGKAEEFLREWSRLALPLLSSADQIVVPSTFLQRIFQDFGLPSTLLPNIADTEQFPFVGKERFAPRLLVTRNLEPMYDVECVLRAFQIVQRHAPHAELGIAGTGSERQRLHDLVQQWGLQNVSFYGVVPHQDLSSLYRQHDIYINASRVDNFPGALVEAACAGLPIVTTCAGGIPEMIRHRENGMLCPVGDAEALANSVLEIVQHPALGRELAQTAHSWAEQFSWRNVFPQLLQCYGLASAGGVATPEEEQILVH